MTQLRMLTVRQPWAEAIVDGHKDTENRSQGFSRTFRGLLLIHSAKAMSSGGLVDPRIRNVYPRRWPESYRLGEVIGLAYVPEIHQSDGWCCRPWGEATYTPANPEDRPPGIVTHLRLEQPWKLDRPVPARGGLGLRVPDFDLRLEVAHALAEQVTWDRAGADRIAEQADVVQLYSLLVDDRASR